MLVTERDDIVETDGLNVDAVARVPKPSGDEGRLVCAVGRRLERARIADEGEKRDLVRRRTARRGCEGSLGFAPAGCAPRS